MTTPAAYLHQHIITDAEAADEIHLLEALAGRELCGLRFFADLEDSRGTYLRKHPIYFFPVGELNGETLGVHLRPDDVAGHRTGLVTAGSFGLIEEGASIRSTVVAALARHEVRGYPAFHKAAALVNTILGPDFYVPGRLGPLEDHTVKDVIAKTVGGWAEYYESESAGKRPPAVKRAFLEEGCARVPGALVLHARLASTCLELGARDAAARAAAAALDCYHHTRYSAKLDKVYAMAQQLAADVPAAFTDRQRTQIDTRTDKARFELAADNYDHGDVAWGTKVLCDLCDDLGEYVRAPMLAVFRKHFEKLGWPWALALCDLRG